MKRFFKRRRLERDLQDEIRSHLEMDKRERIEQGESQEQAHYNARRDFGNVLRSSEDVRETWGATSIDRLIQDAAYAFRQMRRSPGFTFVAILTLALGIGANTAIFSIVNAILLKPLPYKNSDRLVRIVENVPASESFSGLPERETSMSLDEFQEWRSKTKTLSGMAMEMPIAATLMGREAVRLSGERVSPSLFPMLGVQPMLGRVFQPAEEKPGSDKVIIFSYGMWQRLFGGDPQVLGRTVTLDDAAYTVVGVLPRDFAFPETPAEFWTPLALTPPDGGRFIKLRVTARLKDDVDIAVAAAEVDAIGRYMRGEPAETSPGPSGTGPARIQLMTWKDDLIASIRLPLLVFAIAVTFVLLVACINIANLFLARGTTRNQEIAIRMALGAVRARVLRQLLTENFLLAFFGGAAGVVMAFAGTRFFIAAGQSLARMDLMRFESAGNAIPRLNEVGMDGSVLLFALGLTVATGVLFGLIPAFQIGRIRSIRPADLRVAASSKFMPALLRTFMVIGQISLTMILLLGAGLLIKSFVKLSTTNLGYDPSSVLTFTIPQPELDFPRDVPKQAQRTALWEEVVRRLSSRPDIQAAGFTNVLPMIQMSMGLGVKAEGAVKPIRDADYNTVSPDYFRAMGIRVIEGRGFTADDAVRPRPLYVINRTLAREYFPSVSPIGKTISIGPGMASGEIVGVVNDVRQRGFDKEPKPCVYMDAEHTIGIVGVAREGMYFTIRTTKSADVIVPEIRNVIRDIDPNLVIDNIATMEQIVSNSITTPRSYAALLGTFSAAALALATIGLYGVLAYFVTQRTREIGIRIAVGAQRSDVLLLVVRQGLALGIAGVSIGIAGSMALTRYLEKMLFGVTALDPTTFIIVPAVFVAVTLIASYIPARRAARIDPLLAIRQE